MIGPSPFDGLERGAYAAICADPPWSFKTWSETRQTRKASNHYATMPLHEICGLPVGELAAEDSVLFLWVTSPLLPHAFQVMVAWGFTYKTVAFGWAKTTSKTDASWAPKWHVGLGYWSRANLEVCLLGTRGNPRRTHKDVRQLIIAPKREHSRKPEQFYASVERLVPGPYLELFARQKRPGWASWGRETTKFSEVA